MNPLSPQPVPQEFLILQQAEVRPTSWMSWLRLRPQLLKTPEAYLLQLVASAETPMGLAWMALATLVHPLAVETLVILKLPPWTLQVPVLAVQGQSAVKAMPWSLTQARPLQLKPPLQPSLPQLLLQSTSCCSARFTFWPLERDQDSRTATAEKAQQDPQEPWFFTGETCPWVVQSMSALGTTTGSSVVRGAARRGVRQVAQNSASVRAENWLSPILQVWVWSALCFWMISRLRRKMSLLNPSSSAVASKPNCFFHCRQESCSPLAEMQRAVAESSATRTRTNLLSMQIYYNYESFHTYFYSHPRGEGLAWRDVGGSRLGGMGGWGRRFWFGFFEGDIQRYWEDISAEVTGMKELRHVALSKQTQKITSSPGPVPGQH